MARKIYLRDFDGVPIYIDLKPGERIVTVELGSRFPVRVWIEADDDRIESGAPGPYGDPSCPPDTATGG